MKAAFSYWSGYRDELIATGIVFCVAASGSFYMLLNSGLLPKTQVVTEENNEQVLGESDTNTQNQQVVEKIEEVPVATTNPTPSPTASTLTVISPTPTLATPAATPITAYMNGGKTFDYAKYRLALAGLRMVTDQQNQSRVFKVDAILANKAATEGLHNKLSVAIVKDGKIIIENTPLSLTESKTVMPGQQLTFTASISLIEGTDIKEIYYKPGIAGLEEVTFVVIP